VDMNSNTLTIDQEITFYNQTNDTLTSIVLNDWNNAFSDRESPLGKRFSDEFYNKFQLAMEKARGGTFNLFINLSSYMISLFIREILICECYKFHIF